MSADYSWLEKRVFLRKLTSDERSILKVIKTATFSTGETIMAQGQPGGNLYMLRSGKASVHCNGTKVCFAELVEGDCFGVLTFLNSEPAKAEVLAQTECEVYTLAHGEFTELMHDHPDVAYNIFSYILEHKAKLIVSLRSQLLPILKRMKEKSESLPLFIKLFPIGFILLYSLAFFSISWKDFSY